MNFDKTEEKYQIFAKEYVKDSNGSRAAIAAGYSEKTAGATSSRLLKNVKVKHYLGRERLKQQKKLDISAEKVINEIAKVAFGDIGDFIRYTEEGEVFYNMDVDQEKKAIISEVTATKTYNGKGEHIGTTMKLKLYDKLRALDMLAKHLDLYNDKLRIESKVITVNLNPNE